MQVVKRVRVWKAKHSCLQTERRDAAEVEQRGQCIPCSNHTFWSTHSAVQQDQCCQQISLPSSCHPNWGFMPACHHGIHEWVLGLWGLADSSGTLAGLHKPVPSLWHAPSSESAHLCQARQQSLPGYSDVIATPPILPCARLLWLLLFSHPRSTKFSQWSGRLQVCRVDLALVCCQAD